MPRLAKSKFFKLLLSVYSALHVCGIALYPNLGSYLTQYVSPVLLPYANAVGLNSAWSFYAPDPETANHIEYQIDPKGRQFDTDGEEYHLWPPHKKGFFDFRYNRRGASKSYFLANQTWIGGVLVPWICRTHPEAAGVTVFSVMIRVPSLREVAEGNPIYDPSRFQRSEIATSGCQDPSETVL